MTSTTQRLPFVIKLWEVTLILFGVLLVLIPINPITSPIPSRDSGVFLYSGWRILQGEIPYLEIWDHKPPVILYLNALGLMIGNGSLWGLWIIELISLFTAAFIGYYLISRSFGTWPAIITLYLWLYSMVLLIQGGNFTTEFTLPLQFWCLWLAYKAEKRSFISWHGFLIGILCGIAFLTKQNTIGIGIAIALFLIFSRITTGRYRQLGLGLLVVLIGGFFPLIVVFVSFWTQGSLPSLWDAAFKFNLAYSSLGAISHILAPIKGIEILSTSYLAQFALVGWCVGVILIFFNRDFSQEMRALILIALIDFPLELVFVGTSGQRYPHYYMTLLPVLAYLAGLAFWFLFTRISQFHQTNKPQHYFAVCLLSVFIMTHATSYIGRVIGQIRSKDLSAVSYIMKYTDPDDFVLLWGAEASTNFLSRRRSPSRYVYLYPLYQSGYTNTKIVEEFLREIVQHKPSLIVDTHNSRTPFLDFPVSSEIIEENLTYLRSNYRQSEQVGAWTVYHYRDFAK
jgi:4-amino-4-deoxy-L-arabinose transferase-like glycosyltransferase